MGIIFFLAIIFGIGYFIVNFSNIEMKIFSRWNPNYLSVGTLTLLGYVIVSTFATFIIAWDDDFERLIPYAGVVAVAILSIDIFLSLYMMPTIMSRILRVIFAIFTFAIGVGGGAVIAGALVFFIILSFFVQAIGSALSTQMFSVTDQFGNLVNLTCGPLGGKLQDSMGREGVLDPDDNSKATINY